MISIHYDTFRYIITVPIDYLYKTGFKIDCGELKDSIIDVCQIQTTNYTTRYTTQFESMTIETRKTLTNQCVFGYLR